MTLSALELLTALGRTELTADVYINVDHHATEHSDRYRILGVVTDLDGKVLIDAERADATDLTADPADTVLAHLDHIIDALVNYQNDVTALLARTDLTSEQHNALDDEFHAVTHELHKHRVFGRDRWLKLTGQL